MNKLDREELLKIIDPSFYERDTILVAQELLGNLLIRKIHNHIIVTRIIETEAYTGTDDPASHAFKGLKNRNAPMFGPVGHAYIYFTYGNHYCLNVVARTQDMQAGAVLIRAVEPLVGVEAMMQARPLLKNKNLSNGPGKLTQALSINQELNNHDLTKESALYIAYDPLPIDYTVNATPRIGISVAQEKLWRFVYCAVK